MKFLNKVKVAIATTGTGSVTVGSASNSFLTPAQAGATDGVQSRWVLEEGLDWETFLGTPSSSGTVISRDIVEQSFISGVVGTAKMNLTGTATLRAIVSAADMNGFREVLTANRTYYVRTDGSNSNNGLANTSSGAFLTIQKAIDVAVGLDLNVYSVTIQVGAGTYTAPVTLKTYVGVGPIAIIGDETTPANVVISTTSADCITADTVTGKWQIKGLKLTAATSGHGMSAYNGSVIEFGKTNFGSIAAPCAHIFAAASARVTAIDNYSISGGAYIHTQAFRGAEVTTASRTVTLTGTPAFTYYAYATNGAGYYAHAMTFSGAATGNRYFASVNAWIDTVGGGANYFPGNAAGSTSSGGQYV